MLLTIFSKSWDILQAWIIRYSLRLIALMMAYNPLVFKYNSFFSSFIHSIINFRLMEPLTRVLWDTSNHFQLETRYNLLVTIRRHISLTFNRHSWAHWIAEVHILYPFTWIHHGEFVCKKRDRKNQYQSG